MALLHHIPTACAILQIRCHSSYELLASLRTLRPTLDALAAAPGGLACLLIDNVAAFHYLDKAARGAPAGATRAGQRWMGLGVLCACPFCLQARLRAMLRPAPAEDLPHTHCPLLPCIPQPAAAARLAAAGRQRTSCGRARH